MPKNKIPKLALLPVTEYAAAPIQADETSIRVSATPAGRDLVVVSVSTYQGRKALDIRRFYVADEGEWKPTSKGVRVPAPHVAEFLAALCPLLPQLKEEFADA